MTQRHLRKRNSELIDDQRKQSFHIYWRVPVKWINNMVNWNQERFQYYYTIPQFANPDLQNRKNFRP